MCFEVNHPEFKTLPESQREFITKGLGFTVIDGFLRSNIKGQVAVVLGQAKDSVKEIYLLLGEVNGALKCGIRKYPLRRFVWRDAGFDLEVYDDDMIPDSAFGTMKEKLS